MAFKINSGLDSCKEFLSDVHAMQVNGREIKQNRD